MAERRCCLTDSPVCDDPRKKAYSRRGRGRRSEGNSQVPYVDVDFGKDNGPKTNEVVRDVLADEPSTSNGKGSPIWNQLS